MQNKQWGRLLVLVSALFLAAGCSTFGRKAQQAHNAFYGRDYLGAASMLEEESKKDGKDQLLYILDRAMALQAAGKYKESSKLFIQADRMTDIKDYTSLSGETASVIVNDSVLQYKGEDFEKVLINALNSINFVMMGDYEGALVETRRVNNKLYRYKYEAKKNYEQNPFAFYLAGLMWEASGNLDSAYIDIKKAVKLAPHFHHGKEDLVRLAKRVGRTRDLKKLKVDPKTKTPSRKSQQKNGLVVLVYQQGRVAVKRPRPEAPKFPQFFGRYSNTYKAQMIDVESKESDTSEKIYSVSQVAIKTLDDAYGTMVAKRVVGTVAKAAAAHAIAQENEALGYLAWIGLNAIDQADTRSWTTLPESFQFARLWLPPGKRTIKIEGLNVHGTTTGEDLEVEVDVKPGKTKFINWRSIL